MGEQARIEGFKLVMQLRKAGLKCEFDHVGRSMKAQFKYAGKIKACVVAVLGENELAEGNVKLKDMAKGEEHTVALGDILSKVNELLED